MELKNILFVNTEDNAVLTIKYLFTRMSNDFKTLTMFLAQLSTTAS